MKLWDFEIFLKAVFYTFILMFMFLSAQWYVNRRIKKIAKRDG